MSGEPPVQDLVEEATLEFTLGDVQTALSLLDQAIKTDPNSFAAWHARSEVLFDQRRLDEALAAAETAFSLDPNDIHINTSLSRIWMERGDKERAEEFGTKARQLSWKQQLSESSSEP